MTKEVLFIILLLQNKRTQGTLEGGTCNICIKSEIRISKSLPQTWLITECLDCIIISILRAILILTGCCRARAGRNNFECSKFRITKTL